MEGEQIQKYMASKGPKGNGKWLVVDGSRWKAAIEGLLGRRGEDEGGPQTPEGGEGQRGGGGEGAVAAGGYTATPTRVSARQQRFPPSSGQPEDDGIERVDKIEILGRFLKDLDLEAWNPDGEGEGRGGAPSSPSPANKVIPPHPPADSMQQGAGDRVESGGDGLVAGAAASSSATRQLLGSYSAATRQSGGGGRVGGGDNGDSIEGQNRGTMTTSIFACFGCNNGKPASKYKYKDAAGEEVSSSRREEAKEGRGGGAGGRVGSRQKEGKGTSSEVPTPQRGGGEEGDEASRSESDGPDIISSASRKILQENA